MCSKEVAANNLFVAVISRCVSSFTRPVSFDKKVVCSPVVSTASSLAVGGTKEEAVAFIIVPEGECSSSISCVTELEDWTTDKRGQKKENEVSLIPCEKSK